MYEGGGKDWKNSFYEGLFYGFLPLFIYYLVKEGGSLHFFPQKIGWAILLFCQTCEGGSHQTSTHKNEFFLANYAPPPPVLYSQFLKVGEL